MQSQVSDRLPEQLWQMLWTETLYTISEMKLIYMQAERSAEVPPFKHNLFSHIPFLTNLLGHWPLSLLQLILPPLMKMS